MTHQVVVTRPLPEGEPWLAGLHAAGLKAVALPLIELRVMAQPWPALGSREALDDPVALMFVSAAAARYFFSCSGVQQVLCERLRLGKVRAWVTGPGSAQALLNAGVSRAALDMPGTHAEELDAEALWSVVEPQVQPGFRLLIVRGREAESGALGRSWLAEKAARAGAQVAQWVVYERVRPDWDTEQCALARQAAVDGSFWLFSSSLSLANLRALLPEQSWRGARALATHQRIAQAARTAGFGSVKTLQPNLRAVLASIESSNESGERAPAS